MARVTLIQVVYNSAKLIPSVFPAMLNQTFKDAEYVAVICGSEDGSKELITRNFPKVNILDPGANIGFAKAHNLVFSKVISEFYQLVNPDLILSPDYVEKLLKVFVDPKVGAATGKLLKYKFDTNEKTGIIDSTGVTIHRSGRARDRGQHEVDSGQYDNLPNTDAVSGAGCMYRAAALESVKYRLPNSKYEFFDEDFHSYWEDVDLSWRMKNRGWKNVYEPSAVAWHGRSAGSSEKGYVDVLGFIRHHKKLAPRVRQLNFRNHIFMFIKNARWFYPQFFVREFFMFVYIVLFEISTLKVVPEILKLIPKMWAKRKNIQRNFC